MTQSTSYHLWPQNFIVQNLCRLSNYIHDHYEKLCLQNVFVLSIVIKHHVNLASNIAKLVEYFKLKSLQ